MCIYVNMYCIPSTHSLTFESCIPLQIFSYKPLHKHVCIHVCIYSYMYTCIHTHIYIYTCIYAYVCIYVYMNMCTYVRIYVYVYLTDTWIYIYTCVHIYVYIYMYVYIYICIYVYAYICIFIPNRHLRTFSSYIPLQISSYKPLHTRIYMYICTHTHTHTPPIWVRLQTRIDTWCMYSYVQIRSHSHTFTYIYPFTYSCPCIHASHYIYKSCDLYTMQCNMCIYICIYVYICIHLYMYICICVYVYLIDICGPSHTNRVIFIGCHRIHVFAVSFMRIVSQLWTSSSSLPSNGISPKPWIKSCLNPKLYHT